MAKLTKDEIIEGNNYEVGMERLENATNKRWINYWFDCLEQIYHKCEEFAKKYVLDPIKKTVVALVKKVKATKNVDNGSNTYFIKIFDEVGNWIYNKIGKGNDVIKRLNQQKGHTYKEGTTFGSYEIIKSYHLPTDDLALVLESFMRNHFRKNHTLIPNDRFNAFEPTEEDLQAFEDYYNLVVANA